MLESYALTTVTQPLYEPLTLTEVKNHLRLDSSDTSLDADIPMWIAAARRFVENYCTISLVQQTFDVKIDEFPCDGLIEIPKPPLQSVTWIKYYDASGVLQTLDSTYYQVDTDSDPGRIYPSWGRWWPVVLRAQLNAITIRCVAGYAVGSPQDQAGYTGSIPDEIKHAMKMLIGHFDQHRESIGDAVRSISEQEVPQGTLWLLAPYRQSIV